jgi:hypothetical protein
MFGKEAMLQALPYAFWLARSRIRHTSPTLVQNSAKDTLPALVVVLFQLRVQSQKW